MKFVGMHCALTSLGETLERQLSEDNCICAACSIAFCTLYRNVEKDCNDMSAREKRTKKKVDAYWARLKKK